MTYLAFYQQLKVSLPEAGGEELDAGDDLKKSFFFCSARRAAGIELCRTLASSKLAAA